MHHLPWSGSLTVRQAIIVLAGLCWLLPSAAIWLLFPLYLVGGKWEHHYVFDPPAIQVGRGIDRLDPADVQRLSQDPRQAEIMQNMRDLPRQVELHPFWIGSKYGDGRNKLFGLFLFALLAFAGALKFAGIL